MSQPPQILSPELGTVFAVPVESKVQDPSALRVLLASASSGSDGGGELYMVGLCAGPDHSRT